MSNRTVTARRLRLADAIEHGIPGVEFNMDNWCGTACCIAGHAAILAGGGRIWHDPDGISDIAAEWLGLSPVYISSDHRARDLFYAKDVPFSEVTRQRAAAVIRHLAATDQVDWTVGA